MAWYVNFSREAPTSRRCPSKKLPRSWICSITDPESASDLPPLLKCCTSLDNSPPRNGEKEGRGQAPWTPTFHSRSFPLAGFFASFLWYARESIASGMLRPIWDAFSRGNMLESILNRPRNSPHHSAVQKPSPRGEGGPAKPGRMRGRSCTPLSL